MRDDVVEMRFDEMSPGLQALIAYAPNRALDLECPQAKLARIGRDTPVVRWEMGVG